MSAQAEAERWHPWVARARAGDRRALARWLSAIDDGEPGAADAAAVGARDSTAHVVGLTGVPGSGKSTLANALLGAWLERGETVGVVAIDPSSPITGGAVLGDRIRMGEHGSHPRAFVRSFSARGQLGGLSAAAHGAVDAFAAAGYDRVLVETVGTGQSETAIAALADCRIVLAPPGLGDEVQAIKAGTLEIADVVAISKGDLPQAEQTARAMREMPGLRSAVDGTWVPRVVIVKALEAGGIAPLLDAIDTHANAVGRGRRMPGRSQRAADAPPDLAALAASDGLCRALGITFVDGGPGHATVAMAIDARHLNFNGGGHGGAVFALADSAFGLASNSRGPLASGIDAHITYATAVLPGDRLLARATEVQRRRRIAIYRVDVVKDDGRDTLVSTFTGTVSIKV
jgi:LAO/AO transport system kinase